MYKYNPSLNRSAEATEQSRYQEEKNKEENRIEEQRIEEQKLAEKKQEETIIQRAKAGDLDAQEYLLQKYKMVVSNKAKLYFLVGADREDIIQEGMIGLFKAIRDYDCDKTTSFRTFAELCITRQILTAVKTATRQKHIPLNSYISLNKPVNDEGTDKTFMDIIKSTAMSDPEEIFIDREDIIYLEQRTKEVLSSFEKKVLSLYLGGISYLEISARLEKDLKSVDNAIQRIRKKLEKLEIEIK